ncbi:MAG: hypothetical protein NTW70_04050 [Chloroflexi bacterium]|nr:hypothetical protein [Chloroflexota bacterium]
MSAEKAIDPNDPRGGLRGLDAPAIPGGDQLTQAQQTKADADERSGRRGVKLIVGAIVGITLGALILQLILTIAGVGQ